MNITCIKCAIYNAILSWIRRKIIPKSAFGASSSISAKQALKHTRCNSLITNITFSIYKISS